MDALKTGTSILGCMMLAAVAEARVSVSTAHESDSVKQALEGALPGVSACTASDQGAHVVVLETDASGAVRRVARTRSEWSSGAAACADEVLSRLMFAGVGELAVQAELLAAADPATVAGAAPGAEEEKKAWGINAILSQSLGTGAFLAAADQQQVQYGYSLSLRGSYQLTELLSLRARIDASQNLTKSFGDSGTVPNEFFLADARLDLATGNLWTEELTGIGISASTGLRLPTSKATLASERWLGWVIGATLKRKFEGVGPGDLTLSFASSFRVNLGPDTRGISRDESASYFDSCRVFTDAGDECLTSLTNTRVAFSNGLTASYGFLDDFSFTLGVTIGNSFSADVSDSSLASLEARGLRVRQSPFAVDETKQVDLLTTSLELGYTVNNYIELALGTTTESDPFIQSGSNSTALRFPFWDFSSQATNITTVYLDVSFSY